MVAITSKGAQPTSVASTNGSVIVNSNDIAATEVSKGFGKLHEVVTNQAGDRMLAEKQMPNALYYINGKEVTHEIVRALDPAKISRMDVYKSPEAVKKFGEKGKNGVVEVTTK